MMPPDNCPYKELTALPCWNCYKYIPDTDDCRLKYLTVIKTNPNYTATFTNSTYDERLERYERDRAKLLELSKEALVDLILYNPTLDRRGQYCCSLGLENNHIKKE